MDDDMDSSTASLNATQSHDQQNGFWEPPTRRRGNFQILNNGGLGHHHQEATTVASRPSEIDIALDTYEKQYHPGHPKSLSGIATRSFLLGSALTISSNISLYTLVATSSPLWRPPLFITILSLFHFLEFWTTAYYNTRSAQISSFLLSQNGSAYNIAHTTALLECVLSNFFFPNRQWLPSTLRNTLLGLGLVLVVIGQAIRSGAMIAAGTNFNHIVQHTKSSSHQLVTTGLYAFLRHPSYFGFFWWGLGTQLVLGNPICFLGYTLVLWRFFSRRISGEEELLVAFFGDDYVRYRKRTSVGIPFIP
jgi:protein-S-isoprenylcysteine O-methyltransferase